jgi:ribosomal protein S12 methylthiotransferase accessory factor
VRCDGPLGQAVRGAFGARVRFLAQPPGTVDQSPPFLAVGLFAPDEPDASREFATWARRCGIPALHVEERESEVLIGPVALPGRAGCSHCAHQRMIGAAAADSTSTSPPPAAEGDKASRAGEALVREIRGILRYRPETSRLIDHLLVIDRATTSPSLHRVVPLSRCPACGGAAALPRGDVPTVSPSPDDPPEDVLAALAGWVDPRTGVISRLLVERPADTEMELPILATAAPPHVVEDDGSLRRLPIGWGKGLTVSGAILSAVGEAIERYAPSLPDSARIVWKHQHDLDGDVLSPDAFALYSDAQYACDGFPYARFDPSVRHPWVPGTWLGSGRPVWVPAIFAFLSLTLRPENLICQGTSSGLAASTDPDEAALRATLELVERDAFMAAWLAGCPGRRVTPDEETDPALLTILGGVEALGGKVELYVLPTSSCGTTVLCLTLGDGETYPGATIALGCDLDPRLALRQAVLELGQTGPHLHRLMRTGAIPVPAKPEDVREMLDHAAYYFPADRAAAFDRIRSHDAPEPFSDLAPGRDARTLAKCASALNAAGVRIGLVDVTSPDVATGPFRVVRAVSPDLQPLSYGYGLNRQPVERIGLRGLARQIPDIHPIW